VIESERDLKQIQRVNLILRRRRGGARRKRRAKRLKKNEGARGRAHAVTMMMTRTTLVIAVLAKGLWTGRMRRENQGGQLIAVAEASQDLLIEMIMTVVADQATTAGVLAAERTETLEKRERTEAVEKTEENDETACPSGKNVVSVMALMNDSRILVSLLLNTRAAVE